ncbi:hypothetical protein C4B68_12050 [Streptomyces dengpaensis]|uniref:Uncharacterized protein n=1 Tax=Streptomyces dengpaensis TaxID=2049881 RepID=A0ABM6T276_9ACTN|nr:hypothetical protein C4B68_12050 [Streptomyces dengpaensis]PIB05743.1 hypothetical protein B1C81_28225 [Streptomyces sp. HG99]
MRPQRTGGQVEEPGWRSAECTVATRPGYEDLHEECRRTADVPLPHTVGVLLVRRCPCSCHTPGDGR